MDKHSSIPWTHVLNKSIWYTAYKDCDENGKVLRYLFVVKDKNGSGLSAAVHSCYNLGLAHQSSAEWTNYQIKIPIGPNSGAEIDQLYVELSPIETQTYVEDDIKNESDR